jgi:4-hydroxybenzoate polyprenyltransferase
VRQIFYVLQSMRPNQWTKNLVVFAGLVFSRNLFNGQLALKSVEAFVIFCLLSGLIYLVNDIADIDRDRLHERKKNRPLPSGRLKMQVAIIASIVLAVLGFVMSWYVGRGFFILTVVFIGLNMLYSFALKGVVLLDVLSISISFILRAIGGVQALRSIDPSIEISPWLLICTLFLALFLGFCKRRQELVSMDEAHEHRASLREYSQPLLDQLVGITGGGSVIAYAIYTIWPDTIEKFGTADLVYTVPVVLLGVMRYLYLVYSKKMGGSPSDLLLQEKFILITVVVWIALVVAILSFFK